MCILRGPKDILDSCSLFLATAWEERLSSLSPSELFSHQRTFSEAGAPWLFWLREASSPTLITSPTELFAWYADQLGPLVEVCEDSLATPPPALLLLLRMLRFSLTDNGGRGGDIELNVIELYARDGLAILSTLVDCTADHLLLQQSNTRGYVRGSVETMVADMMAEGVAILTHLVIALADAIGEDFRDRTPVKAVCRAYAAAAVVHYRLSENVGQPLEWHKVSMVPLLFCRAFVDSKKRSSVHFCLLSGEPGYGRIGRYFCYCQSSMCLLVVKLFLNLFVEFCNIKGQHLF